MSERGAGFGSFLLGLGIGAVLGFLFAPEPGDATRVKLTRKLRGLRDLAAEKAGELGELLDAGAESDLPEREGAGEDEGEGEGDHADLDEPPAREAVARRLTDAKRQRRGARADRERRTALPRPTERGEEEDEPVA
ncbi:MAG TPA: YtxH domain-containing protein [Gemmatimonadales bacterium]|nr:YtxH domain-containing protein [Gemmatimonadales bacterium]